MARHIQRNVSSYARQYSNEGRSILDLARRENYPPYLLSRFIVEQIAQLPDGKKGLTRSMRDPMGVLGDPDVIRSEYQESELHTRPDSQTTTNG